MSLINRVWKTKVESQFGEHTVLNLSQKEMMNIDYWMKNKKVTVTRICTSSDD